LEIWELIAQITNYKFPITNYNNMNKIALPKKIDFKKGEKPNQGIITIEPCYPGYGITIGNSLRRVMLSSLPGSAVVGVKIKGASHEFMTLPHVKEDVLEIILNLKQLRLKILEKNPEEEIKLELDVAGKKEVKAGDIKKNSKVEIVNPELNIANITDMAGSLNIEIYVEKGRGYRPVEQIDVKKSDIGYIDMDSIFSPVLSTSMKVENVRVGKMTNWDKLVLDIVTDGTITPQEAFEGVVKILINQFSALIGKGKKESEDIKEETEDKKEKKEAKEKPKKEVKEEAEEKVEDLEEKPKKKRGRPKKVE